MSGQQAAPFTIGDRVRVADEWEGAEFRGAVGIVVEVDGVLPPGWLWVEFAPAIYVDDGECNAATFPPESLTRISP
jgi:hypothetical protein